jgi:phosphoglycolate phosphatase-like HAD superfamily hydrolase
VPDLLRGLRDAGLPIAVASSAKRDELDKYLDIAGIADLVDATTSSEDADESKPAPDVFEVILKKLGIAGTDAVAIGDTPYDATAAGKAGVATIGVLWRLHGNLVAPSRMRPNLSRACRLVCLLPHRTKHLRLVRFSVTSRRLHPLLRT